MGIAIIIQHTQQIVLSSWLISSDFLNNRYSNGKHKNTHNLTLFILPSWGGGSRCVEGSDLKIGCISSLVFLMPIFWAGFSKNENSINLKILKEKFLENNSLNKEKSP